MKVIIENGKVTLTSENATEAHTLAMYAIQHTTLTPKAEEKSEEKPHKKYNVAKACDICGSKHKGTRAMAIHKAMKHAIYSENYENNKKYREEQAKLTEGLLGSVNNI